MLNSLKHQFKGKTKKNFSYIFDTERETLERKKCKNCLQNIKIEYLKCPHCGGSSFYSPG